MAYLIFARYLQMLWAANIAESRVLDVYLVPLWPFYTFHM